MQVVADAAGAMPHGWNWERLLRQADEALAEESLHKRESSGFSAFLHQRAVEQAMKA